MIDRRQIHKIPQSSEMVSKNNWLVIFGDLLALMVTFFVLMFSMTGLDPQKWQQLQESLEEELRFLPILPVETATMVPELEVGTKTGISLDYLKTVLEGKEVVDDLIGSLALYRQEAELVIVLDVRKYFNTSLQDLRDPAKRIVGEIAQSLNDVPNDVQLLGFNATRLLDKSNPSAVKGESIRFAMVIKDYMQAAGFDKPLWVGAAGLSEYQDLAGDFATSMLYNVPDRVEIRIKERQRNDALSQLYKR